jgi:hypothetical protein
MNCIAIDGNDVDIQLINPDVAIQEVADDIHDSLGESLQQMEENPLEKRWCDEGIFTVGDPQSVESDVAKYINALRRS